MALLVATLLALAGYLWVRPPIEHRLRAYAPPAARASSRTWPWTQRRNRALLERQSPGALTVLIALLDSGIPISDSVRAAAESTAEPLGSALHEIAESLRMGASMRTAWQPLAHSDAWVPVLSAMERSARTGAALSSVLTHAAAEMRDERRSRATVAARKAGVRAILPLVLCCLPAFIALGIVPVVASFMAPIIDGVH